MSNTLAFIISLDDEASRKATNKCIESIKDTKSPIQPVIFPAVTPKEVDKELYDRKLEYTYPTGVARQENGLILTPYKTKDIKKIIACALSHLKLWEIISALNHFENYIILEQDALFIKQYDREYFENSINWINICSLNSPINATRKSSKFDTALKSSNNNFKKEYKETGESILKHFPIPWIDDKQIPQGLPGNSAYIITPDAAKRLIDKVHEVGLWPNDALMNKQFFPDMLFAAYPYYTKVQNNPSTTSL